MSKIITVILINTFSLFLVSNIMYGIIIDGWQTLIASAIVLTFINIFLKPIIKFITLPINILSLGFFTLIINATILYFVSDIVKGFHVAGFAAAFWGALLLSIIYMIVELFVLRRNEKIIIRRYNVDSHRNIANNSNVIDVEEIEDEKK